MAIQTMIDGTDKPSAPATGTTQTPRETPPAEAPAAPRVGDTPPEEYTYRDWASI